MESKEPITAEEFFANKIKERFPTISQFHDRRYSLNEEDATIWAHEYAVLFAKWHREQIIEAIKCDIRLIEQDEYIDCTIGYQKVQRVDPDSIENAYPESLIK